MNPTPVLILIQYHVSPSLGGFAVRYAAEVFFDSGFIDHVNDPLPVGSLQYTRHPGPDAAPMVAALVNRGLFALCGLPIRQEFKALEPLKVYCARVGCHLRIIEVTTAI